MKTITQAAKEYRETILPNPKDWTPIEILERSFASTIEDTFRKAVEFAQTWVSVNDELPEENTDVLVICKNGKRTQKDVDYVFNGKFTHRTNVEFWRPIEIKY
jgi:hypothetical protein